MFSALFSLSPAKSKRKEAAVDGEESSCRVVLRNNVGVKILVCIVFLLPCIVPMPFPHRLKIGRW